MIRGFLFWLVWNVPLGRFAPWVMSLAMGRWPYRQMPKEKAVAPERQEYKLTEEQYQSLLDASKPVIYIVAGGLPPTSPQEHANAAWRAMGRELGFDPMTVETLGGGDSREFTAIPIGTQD